MEKSTSLGEHAMKDEETFSHERPPSTTSGLERSSNSDGHAHSSPPTLPQDTPSSAHLPRMERRLSLRPRMRLLLVAGGYGLFRAVSPSPRQAPSALQQA